MLPAGTTQKQVINHEPECLSAKWVIAFLANPDRLDRSRFQSEALEKKLRLTTHQISVALAVGAGTKLGDAANGLRSGAGSCPRRYLPSVSFCQQIAYAAGDAAGIGVAGGVSGASSVEIVAPRMMRTSFATPPVGWCM